MTIAFASEPDIRYTGLIRRLMAILYDLFLLLAILFITTAVANALNQGESIDPDNPYYPYFVFCLLAISFFYYGWFWTHGGQTLGMKTWKMKLQSEQSRHFSWKQAAIRFLTAQLSWLCGGTGFLWSVFNRQNRTWHDIASSSVLVDLR